MAADARSQQQSPRILMPTRPIKIGFGDGSSIRIGQRWRRGNHIGSSASVFHLASWARPTAVLYRNPRRRSINLRRYAAAAPYFRLFGSLSASACRNRARASPILPRLIAPIRSFADDSAAFALRQAGGLSGKPHHFAAKYCPSPREAGARRLTVFAKAKISA